MAADTEGPLVLVCDATKGRRQQFTGALSGYRLRDAADVSSLPERTRTLMPSLVVIACSPPEQRDTFAAIERIRSAGRHLPIVLIALNGSEALAVAALRAGVADYFSEPVDPHALAASIRRHLSSSPGPPAGRAAEDTRPRPRAAAGPRLIGTSAFIRSCEDYLGKIAQRDVTVLISGETGTGKELAATFIHARSRRRDRPFVSVNCAAIPEALLESELFGHERGAFTGALGARPGLLQAAEGGTILLDEIGDMGMVAQAKVLRAIEAREVYRVGGTKAIPLDVRVLAATNQDLERAVDEGRFRKDLYFRLNVARVHLPPLRERRADIAALLDHYVRELNAQFRAEVDGFSDEAISALQAYDWPGNIRELKNLVEVIFISPPAQRVGVADLPEAFRARLRSLGDLRDTERRRLVEALLAVNWNKSRAAEKLHWSRMTVYRKIAKYGVVRSTDARVRDKSEPAFVTARPTSNRLHRSDKR